MEKSTRERSDGDDAFIPHSAPTSGERVTKELGGANDGEAGEWEEETPTVRVRNPLP